MNITNQNANYFFRYFNYLVIEKTKESEQLKSIFHPPSPQKTSVITNAIGIEILKELPTDLQEVVLNKAEDPEHFNCMSLLCSRKVIDNQTTKLLKNIDLYKPVDRIAMKLPGSSPQKYLWIHVFREIRHRCNLQELETIVEWTQDNTLKIVSNKVQTVFEKVIRKISALLSNFAIRIGIGIVVGYQTWKISHLVVSYIRAKIIPTVVNKIINMIPLSIIQLSNQVISKSYPWIDIIIIGVIGGHLLLPRNAHLAAISRAMMNIILIPIRISMIPFSIALKAFEQSITSSNETSRLMRNGVDKATIQRIKKGLDKAETLWVQHMMQEV